MIVEDILRHKGRDVFTVGPETTVRDLAEALTARKIGAAVVTTDAGSVAGLISERDIVHGVADHGDVCLARKVRDLMTREVVTCTSDTRIEEVMSLMTERRIRHVPVVDDGRMTGLVSIGDVVKNRIAEAEREADQLRQYITA